MIRILRPALGQRLPRVADPPPEADSGPRARVEVEVALQRLARADAVRVIRAPGVGGNVLRADPSGPVHCHVLSVGKRDADERIGGDVCRVPAADRITGLRRGIARGERYEEAEGADE